MRLLQAALAGSAISLLGLAATHAVAPTTPINLGQSTPYSLGVKIPATAVPIPAGFSPVYYENIGRHGARAAIDSTQINKAVSLYRNASDANALLPTATNLGKDLATLQTVQNSVGAGRLSNLGHYEWREIGGRAVQAYPDFWDYASAKRGTIDVWTSGKSRAKSSAASFIGGAKAAGSDIDLSLRFSARRTVNSQLYLGNTLRSAGKTEWLKIYRSSATAEAAHDALTHLFKPGFVNSMTSSEQVSAARSLWEAVAITPGLVDDGAVDMSSYIPADAAEQLAYVKDARAFYQYGPGIKGSTVTYRNADVVRDSFFREIDDRLFRGGKTVATLRFSHGETTMPFYAYLGLNPQATISKPFTYASTNWSGNDEAKYATNLDWLVVAKGGKASRTYGRVLITMRVNEQPQRFSSRCAKYEVRPYWYDRAGLKKCVNLG